MFSKKALNDSDAADDAPPSYSSLHEELAGLEDQLTILSDYDTVMIVDDSKSMELLWGQACRALSTLAVVASRYDTDGIDIRFLNRGKVKLPYLYRLFVRHLGSGKSRRFTSEQDVNQLFKKVTPCGPTPIGMCLETVAEKLLKKVEKGEPCKKTNLLVITDGQPTDDARGAVVNIARRLDRAGAPTTQIGIQLVQIGTDAEATAFLSELDNGLKKHGIRDIVDTQKYTDGNVTAQILIKLLLGSLYLHNQSGIKTLHNQFSLAGRMTDDRRFGRPPTVSTARSTIRHPLKTILPKLPFDC